MIKKTAFLAMVLLPVSILLLVWGRLQDIPGWFQMTITVVICILAVFLTNLLFWQRLIHYMNARLEKFNESLSLHSQECPVKKEMLRKSSITINDSSNNCETFRRLFQASEPTFLFRLREIMPGITPTEELLCICIKMGLSTNEVASRMSISKNSVHTFRYRFKRKAQLADNESLDDWINNIK